MNEMVYFPKEGETAMAFLKRVVDEQSDREPLHIVVQLLEIALGELPQQLILHQGLGLLKIPFQGQITGLLIIGRRSGPVGIFGVPGPERFLVQGDSFLPAAAEQHGPQPPVSQGQRFLPLDGEAFG